jgi:hypothetical protein
MRGLHRLVGLAGMVLCVAAVAPAPAGAAQTIGQTGLDGGACTNRVYVQHDLASGPSYSASSSGVITSWSAQANGATGQTLQLVVLSQNGSLEYTILRRDSVRTLANLNALNTFAGLNLPIEAGQLIAVYDPPGSTADCESDGISSGDNVAFSDIGNPSDNVPTGYFGFDSPFRVNAQAVVEPTNTFTLGATTRNKKKGTASVTATVPNPGELTGSGKGVKVASAAGAVTSKTITTPGAVKLTIKAKGKNQKTLNETGKVTVKPKITYTPTNGAARTQSIKVKLKKNL